MKVVILAGGLGTRMSELTKIIPKPMVKILNKPILIHIMEHYYKFGFKEFKIFNELTKPFTSVHLKSTIKMPITIKVKKRQFALSAEQK